MDKNVFPLKKVGDFFNENFINYKVDMEKGEGIKLKEKFYVAAFPTLLWVDHKGNIVHRIVGGYPAEGLIAEGKNALNGGNMNTDIEKKYNRNKKNPEIVKQYFLQLKKNYDARTNDIALQYINLLDKKDYLLKENWDIISKYVKDPYSSILTYIYKNRAEFDKVFTAQKVDILFYAKCYNHSQTFITAVRNGKEFDTAAFQKLLSFMDDRKIIDKNYIAETTRLNVLKFQEDWHAYIQKIESLVASGFYKEINFQTYFKWYNPFLSSNSTDKEVVLKMIEWVEKAIELNDSFKMVHYNLFWNGKINLYERLGEDYQEEVSKLKTELNFINYLKEKQDSYNKKQKAIYKKTTSGKRKPDSNRAIRIQ